MPRYQRVGGPIRSLLPFRVLIAFRLHRGGQKAKGKRQKWEVGAQRLAASQRWASFTFYLLPFAFQQTLGNPSPRAGASGNETRVASVRNPKSKIENPQSCVGPSAILTGSRTRPSDWGSNARFGPVEDRRNNRRLATFTCTLCVLQIWWLSPFTFGFAGPKP